LGPTGNRIPPAFFVLLRAVRDLLRVVQILLRLVRVLLRLVRTIHDATTCYVSRTNKCTINDEKAFSNDTDLHNAALETRVRALETILDDEFKLNNISDREPQF
ncbi:hypothetical protein T4B_5198, partial [Trichinella pseudospiralis]